MVCGKGVGGGRVGGRLGETGGGGVREMSSHISKAFFKTRKS